MKLALLPVDMKQKLNLAGFDDLNETIKSARNYNGESPFVWAARMHEPELMLLLIRYGERVNRYSYSGESGLNAAIKKSDTTMVKLLCELGADVNNLNKKNQTPLMIAAIHNNADIINVLMEHDARINIINSNHETALITAVKFHQVNAVNALLAFRAKMDVNTKSERALIEVSDDIQDLTIEKLLLEEAKKQITNDSGTYYLWKTRNKPKSKFYQNQHKALMHVYAGIHPTLNVKKEIAAIIEYGISKREQDYDRETAALYAPEPVTKCNQFFKLIKS